MVKCNIALNRWPIPFAEKMCKMCKMDIQGYFLKKRNFAIGARFDLIESPEASRTITLSFCTNKTKFTEVRAIENEDTLKEENEDCSMPNLCAPDKYLY